MQTDVFQLQPQFSANGVFVKGVVEGALRELEPLHVRAKGLVLTARLRKG